ncbi:hypothetical protein GYMC52_2566 [Geobacillus sp. Y412MC52]|nr:hypothetical protein GYMC52_2566 [Geobacillus sp. Y412MC52]
MDDQALIFRIKVFADEGGKTGEPPVFLSGHGEESFGKATAKENRPLKARRSLSGCGRIIDVGARQN